MGFWRSAGAFAVRQLTDKVTSGAKPAKRTACPDVSGSTSQ